MALTLKYKSRTSERTESGYVRKQTLQGSFDECTAYQTTHAIGEYLSGFGRLASSSISQHEGNIWQIELRYIEDSSGLSVSIGTVPPDTSFGVFSATLDVTMMSNPLEAHPSYRTCWNHYLAARDDATTESPSWWSTATDPLLIGTAAQTYRWMKSESELIIGPDAEGHTWKLVKKRTKAADQYDVALYTQTETARFATFALACAAIAAKANRTASSPGVANGLTGGNWKCDRATVRYSGAWLASITWTMSYDSSGWDSDLYDPISGTS